MINRKISLLLICFIAVSFLSCGRNTEPMSGTLTLEVPPIPTGLAGYEPIPIPADNPMTIEKVWLGRQLFFDDRLSVDNSRS
jgi:cytochrome c peroxidase